MNGGQTDRHTKLEVGRKEVKNATSTASVDLVDGGTYSCTPPPSIYRHNFLSQIRGSKKELNFKPRKKH